LSYLPTINQTALLRGVLDASGFGLADTTEILRRTWHIENRSVRPDHRMVAHTGFLTTARRLADTTARPHPAAERPQNPAGAPSATAGTEGPEV
jgi:hypothetical protein